MQIDKGNYLCPWQLIDLDMSNFECLFRFFPLRLPEGNNNKYSIFKTQTLTHSNRLPAEDITQYIIWNLNIICFPEPIMNKFYNYRQFWEWMRLNWIQIFVSANISILPGLENGAAENHAARREDALTLEDAVNAEKSQNSPRYTVSYMKDINDILCSFKKGKIK